MEKQNYTIHASNKVEVEALIIMPSVKREVCDHSERPSSALMRIIQNAVLSLQSYLSERSKNEFSMRGYKTCFLILREIKIFL